MKSMLHADSLARFGRLVENDPAAGAIGQAICALMELAEKRLEASEGGIPVDTNAERREVLDVIADLAAEFAR